MCNHSLTATSNVSDQYCNIVRRSPTNRPIRKPLFFMKTSWFPNQFNVRRNAKTFFIAVRNWKSLLLSIFFYLSSIKNLCRDSQTALSYLLVQYYTWPNIIYLFIQLMYVLFKYTTTCGILYLASMLFIYSPVIGISLGKSLQTLT